MNYERMRVLRAQAKATLSEPSLLSTSMAVAIALEVLDATMDMHARLADIEACAMTAVSLVGCGDNSCRFIIPRGQGTNGGCRCHSRPLVMSSLARLLMAAAPQKPEVGR